MLEIKEFEITMENLENCFYFAKENNAKYVAVLVEMQGFEESEIIINKIANVDTKLEYYKKVYDEKLNHKFSEGIKIIGCTYGNNLEDIESDFFGELI